MLGLMRVRRAMFLTGMVVLLLAVAVGLLPAVAWGAGWSVVPSPNLPGEEDVLSGVSCVSADACTAVGYSYALSEAVAERWNGRTWSIQFHPGSRGAGSVLSGVSCVSADACTAVGLGATGPLAERWNGTRWVVQPTPAHSGQLVGVSCLSARACTAVGAREHNDGALAEVWDGKRWAIQPTPKLRSFGGLSGVSCVSARACTAVGIDEAGMLAERWNGTKWSIQPTPNPAGAGIYAEAYGVSCVAARACTAVGEDGDAEVTLAERWNGRSWAIQPTPKFPYVGAEYSPLQGVSCVSTRACIAVGTCFCGGNNPEMPLAELWDGARWIVQPMPKTRPDQSGLLGVSCTSASACTAVGEGGLIESWTAPSAKFTVSHIKTEADGTTTFSLRVPGPGSVDVLETAWKDNLARAAVLKPAAERFVFARQHVHAPHGGTVSVTVNPNPRGRRLVARHRYRVVLRLWVTYTPSGGLYRSIGFLGLHLPGSCANHNNVAALDARTVVRCN